MCLYLTVVSVFVLVCVVIFVRCVLTRELCLVVVHLNRLAKAPAAAANPQNGDNKDHHHYQPLHHHHHQITKDNSAWVSLKSRFILTFHFTRLQDYQRNYGLQIIVDEKFASTKNGTSL